jgi:hypothetical protein
MCSYDKLYSCLFLFIHITGRVFHIALSPRILERISHVASTGYSFLTDPLYEVAANTWPAVLAMLQYQNNLYEGELESQAEVYWPLPLTDATYYLMADHLPMRSEIDSYPDGGWMARMVSFPSLVQSLLPLWQDRWQKHHIEWAGVLALAVDEDKCMLELSPSLVRLVDRLFSKEQEAKFSQQVFTQLVFGFRPVAWAAIRAGQHVPGELVPILDVLFPHKQSWIAGSDYF